MRLVSLLPSATEIVYALGLGGDLVGVTFECDEPPAARVDKTVVVAGRDTSGMSPAEIDSYVRAQLDAGADLYTLHAQALATLEPELILTQDLCRVCAIPSGHVEDALDYLGCRAEVLSLDPHSLQDVLDSILAIGQAAGAAERAAHLVAGLRARIDLVAGRVAGASSHGGRHRMGRPAVHSRALDTGPRHRCRWPAGRGQARRAIGEHHLGRHRRCGARGRHRRAVRLSPGGRGRAG